MTEEPLRLPRFRLRAYFSELHARLCAVLEAADGRPFQAHPWRRSEPTPEQTPGKTPGQRAAAEGEGVTCILEDGQLFERAGVAFSHVRGATLPASANARHPGLSGMENGGSGEEGFFEAIGVSLVLHPRNPYCPTAHMNVRVFLAGREEGEAEASSVSARSLPAPSWWFGGGMDLTPYYPFAEDVRHFHATCREALRPFGGQAHAHYKKWCDDYFFLPHRNEARGVGGIFFDDLNAAALADLGEPEAPTPGDPFERCFALVRSVGDAFPQAYLPILEKRRALAYGAYEREFQAYRRGRYVEFNLLHDRGTLFGLQSGGRVESILLSLPPRVSWRYDWHPEPGSPEARLYEEFLPPRDWV